MKRAPKSNRRQRQDAEIIPFKPKFELERSLAPIEPKTKAQANYQKMLRTSEQVVAIGPAGTGKSFIAATHAADLLRLKRVQRVVITRPNVPGGRSLGFFPGDMKEKFGPWVAQIAADMTVRMGRGAFDVAIGNGDIEFVPFEVMRGRSWSESFILLDEAQNTTVDEMKMFLTRQGENSISSINGDLTQNDLKRSGTASGLATMIHLIKQDLLPVPIIEFDADDIVRGGLCGMWVKTFTDAGM